MHSLKDLKKFSKKALIIIAHPDDESLFMGGTIAEFKKWSWTVLCVTDCDERYNKRRRQELLMACRTYNRNGSHVKPSMLGITKKRGRFSKGEVVQRIRDFVDEFGPFDIVFTHSKKGDYSHKTHRLVHDVIRENLRFPNVFNFYLAPYKKAISMSSEVKPLKYIQAINLSPKSRCIKRQVINIYLKGSQKTNLSRLKRLLSYALNTKTEWFYRGN